MENTLGTVLGTQMSTNGDLYSSGTVEERRELRSKRNLSDGYII